MLKKLLLGLGAVLLVIAAVLYVIGLGTFGTHEGPGEVLDARRPKFVDDEIAKRGAGAAEGIGAARDKQILFGDLHVHTTFSVDAFLRSAAVPCRAKAAHPPADACDFARLLLGARLLVASTTTPKASRPSTGQQTKEAIRQCNERRRRSARTPTYGLLPRLGVDAGRDRTPSRPLRDTRTSMLASETRGGSGHPCGRSAAAQHQLRQAPSRDPVPSGGSVVMPSCSLDFSNRATLPRSS